MSDLSAFLYPVVDKLPIEYRSLNSISVAMSPYDWEEARKKYAAYELLVDACRKAVVSFNTRSLGKGVPRYEDLDPMILKRWKEEVEKADAAAIDALYKALLAVEEIG